MVDDSETNHDAINDHRENLKTLILAVLPTDGLSIASICRLVNARGFKLHRLELGGYLKALADVGILQLRDNFKPCLVFAPRPVEAAPHADQPGEAAAELKGPVISHD